MGSKAVPEGEYATDAEIEAAIRSLSDADGVRLRKVASFRAHGLAGLGLGMSADDLLQEALYRTFDGRRKWKKGVAFLKHLLQTMRSIASHARGELNGGVVVPDTVEDSTGRLDGVNLRARDGNGEIVAAANERLALIRKKFENDDEVSLVLEGHAKEMTGPEIQTDLGLTQTQYETIMTRLRRGVDDREEGWRP